MLSEELRSRSNSSTIDTLVICASRVHGIMANIMLKGNVGMGSLANIEKHSIKVFYGRVLGRNVDIVT